MTTNPTEFLSRTGYRQVTASVNAPITLSGAVTGTGTGAIVTTMAPAAIDSLAGYNHTGVFSDVTVSTGLTLFGGVLTATGSGGTVTTVSVVTANGVSGSVANPTTTPAITLTLGVITPTSVAASGAVTGSNLSGTNTGDQTITLTGGVTGSGTGSFAATVVTNANLTGPITSAGNATSIASSVALPGSPTTTTQAQGTSNTTISTTAYVDTAVANSSSGSSKDFTKMFLLMGG